MKPRAVCMIRDAPVYRRDAFLQGLAVAGFDCTRMPVNQARPGDVLVIWNRYAEWHHAANVFESKGGTVLVAENGYVGNDRSNRTVYAIARGGHNGSGSWALGGPERWDALNVKLQPWRTDGTHVLVCPNRSFGMPGFIMPPTWPEVVAAKLQHLTKRPVRVRPHPGNDLPRGMAEALRDCWAMVIWSSSAGCEALIAGIPVICTAPWWVLKHAASGNTLESVASPVLTERLPAFHALAWQQWHLEEIRQGLPFHHMCQRELSHA